MEEWEKVFDNKKEEVSVNLKTGNVSKSKTLENLKKSRERRKEIISKYGEVPTSIWKMSFKKNKMVVDPRPRQDEVAWEDSNLSKDLKNAWGLCNKSVRNGAQSTLPYDMAERVFKFYSEKGDTILDPTLGDPTVMTVAYHLERNLIGYDISEENFNINLETKDLLFGNGKEKKLVTPDINIDVYNKSSEKMDDVSDESTDLVFFSPPYWDIEFYGKEEKQLGYKKTYEEFLKGLGRIINETYRVLKYDKYCVININDFVKKGKFYDYHMDVAKLMTDAGFRRHDTIIIQWNNCIGQAFASQVEDWKKTAKTHEYLIVGKKVRNKNEYKR